MSTSLHELQGSSFDGDGRAPEPPCVLALQANFGSAEAWRVAFAEQLLQADAGAWLLLAFEPASGRLVHQRLVLGMPPGLVPLLALQAGSAVAARWQACIHWAAVYKRYQEAVHEASGAWAATRDELAGRLLLDVRRAGIFDKAETLIPGARWCDPAAVGRWAGELPQGSEVLVYCIYGHEVGRSTALRLRAAGVNARFLEGGIDGWQAAGLPLQPKVQP